MQTAQIIVAKNMNGAIADLDFNFHAEIPAFFEMAEEEEKTEKSSPLPRVYKETEDDEEIPF